MRVSSLNATLHDRSTDKQLGEFSFLKPCGIDMFSILLSGVDLTEAVETGFGRRRVIIWAECLEGAQDAIRDQGLSAGAFRKALQCFKSLKSMGKAKASDQRDYAVRVFKYYYENCLGSRMSNAFTQLLPFEVPSDNQFHSSFLKSTAALLATFLSDLQSSRSVLLMPFPVVAIGGTVQTLEEFPASRKCEWWEEEHCVTVQTAAADLVNETGNDASRQSSRDNFKKDVEPAVNLFFIGINHLNVFNKGKKMAQYKEVVAEFTDYVRKRNENKQDFILSLSSNEVEALVKNVKSIDGYVCDDRISNWNMQKGYLDLENTQVNSMTTGEKI